MWDFKHEISVKLPGLKYNNSVGYDKYYVGSLVETISYWCAQVLSILVQNTWHF